MGDCKYCRQPAGFLRGKHKKCNTRHRDGQRQMVQITKQAILTPGSDLTAVKTTLDSLAEETYNDGAAIRHAVITAWADSVNHFLDDGELDEREETRLTQAASQLDLSQSDFEKSDAWQRMVKGAVLRDILNGNVPERIRIDGDLPFNFMKSEKLLWIFPAVDYYEDRVRRHYVGGHSGVSVRIAKGLYYRTGSFKGERVETTETVHLGRGTMAVTTKHIYFDGPHKAFRIRHDKVVTFHPYEDGVGVQRDAQTAKPQMFKTGDGWFTYNLLINASNL